MYLTIVHYCGSIIGGVPYESSYGVYASPMGPVLVCVCVMIQGGICLCPLNPIMFFALWIQFRCICPVDPVLACVHSIAFFVYLVDLMLLCVCPVNPVLMYH